MQGSDQSGIKTRRKRRLVESRIGDVHGCLTIIGIERRNGCNSLMRVRCQCGEESSAWLNSLVGKSERTYCEHCQPSLEDWQVAIRGVWSGMIERCNNPRHQGFANYGGRGIAVCERWQNDFLAFCSDMGPRPAGMSIDRINNDGNYEPSNCRWASKREQLANTRKNRHFTICGVTMISSEWANLCGISREGMRKRFERFSPEDAVLVYESAARSLGVAVRKVNSTRSDSATASLLRSPVKAICDPDECTICNRKRLSVGLCRPHYMAFNRLSISSPEDAAALELSGKIIRGIPGRPRKRAAPNSGGWGPH